MKRLVKIIKSKIIDIQECKTPPLTLIIVVLLTIVFPNSSQAQYVNETPEELQEVGVNEQLGETIPASDIHLVNHLGNKVTLDDYLGTDKPILLNLVYYDCPMLCSLVMQGMLKSMRRIDWTPGKEFTILTISIDPDEGTELAANYREAYHDSLNLNPSITGWEFFTSNQKSIDTLASSVGFKFKYDPDIDQYAHSAAIMFLDPNGKVSRYLYGIEYSPIQVKKALDEASEGEIGTTVDQILMYCYQYDPSSKSYVPYALNIMKLGGLVIMIGLGSFLGIMWYRERKNKTTART